jgi:hypothetical protein
MNKIQKNYKNLILLAYLTKKKKNKISNKKLNNSNYIKNITNNY